MSYFTTLVDKISRSHVSSHSETVPKDISVCVAIRASNVNPWVLERLEFLVNFYQPKPSFVVIDFGSEDHFAVKIKEICQQGQAAYHYIDDKDVFAAGKARNIAGRVAETEFLFFTDVDFVYDRRIFGQLANVINDLEVKSAPRRFFPMPIFHVGKDASAEYEQIESYEERNKFVAAMGYLGHGSAFKGIFEFVAPYSNAFLISKEFFNLSGGYCDEFRGHGSEDFEFLIRIGILSTNTPLPNSLNKDFYGPLKESFFGYRDYTGFRAYFEAITAPAEALGLKAFHIWHDKPKENGYWTAQNDWKRDRFNDVIGRYYPKIENIINVDFHPREKSALCLFSDKKSWGYFLPLRSFGYKLQAVTELSDENLYKTLNDIEMMKYDSIIIFNPYMKSHAKYRGILELARRLNIKITVIERGGLPNSIYYADEVAYGDPDYKRLDEILKSYQPRSIKLSRDLISSLQKGGQVLETQEPYEQTWKKQVFLRHSESMKIFIPLQLPDDMAVTKFTDGYTAYSDFYDEISTVVQENPEIIFVIKQHPLLKGKFDGVSSEFENLVIADDAANIHALIDVCTATVVYNSGVGLLSCLHAKPTFNVGNAYYSTPSKLSNSVCGIQEAIDCLKTSAYHTTSEEDLLKFFDWLINEKYSWFTADNVIREFKDRKAHGYDNIMVEVISINGQTKNCGARYSSFPFDRKSYLGWKAKIGFSAPSVPEKQKSISSVIHQPDSSKKRMLTAVLSLFMTKKKSEKLKKDPAKFFEDAKNPMIKRLRKYYVI